MSNKFEYTSPEDQALHNQGLLRETDDPDDCASQVLKIIGYRPTEEMLEIVKDIGGIDRFMLESAERTTWMGKVVPTTDRSTKPIYFYGIKKRYKFILNITTNKYDLISAIEHPTHYDD